MQNAIYPRILRKFHPKWSVIHQISQGNLADVCNKYANSRHFDENRSNMVEWSLHCFSGFATARQDSAVQSEDGRRYDGRVRDPASSPFTIGLLLEGDGNN